MIKAGDLVMVTKPTPCCGADEIPGSRVFVAGIVRSAFGFCGHCGLMGDAVVTDHPAGFLLLVCRLTKIVPDGPLVDVDEPEEIAA